MSDTSRYEPPAELVERAAADVHNAYLRYMHQHGLAVKPEMDLPFEALSEVAKDIDRTTVRACLAASGLGEVVEVLRKVLSLVGDYKVATDAEKTIAEEVRALLARLDTRT